MRRRIIFFTLTLLGLSLVAVNFASKAGVGRPMAPELVFSTTTVPNGRYGASYNTLNLKVTGGKAPYSFAVTKGNLPKGISLSNNGALSGTSGAAGRYSFTVTATDNTKPPNQLSASQDYTLAIDQTPLTITTGNASMTYGGQVPAPSLSYSGFVNGDNISSLTTQPTVTTAASSSSPAGTYSITAIGAADPNYLFSYIAGTLYVNPATVFVTAKAQTKEYGAADPVLSYTVSGLLNGDNTSVFSGGLSRTAGENVGAYPITKGNISAGGNYTIGYTGNYLTITIASQHITWVQSLLIGCNNTTQVQLTAIASSGLPVSYSVADPGVATVSGSMLTLLKPGSTVVTATQAGDANHSAAAAVADTMKYQPASLIRQQWNDVIFFDNSSGDYVQWQWYKNGDSVAGATAPYYTETPSLNGQYYVIATDKSGHSIQSCTLAITGGAAIAGGIKVQPNPVNAGGKITVTSNFSSAALQGAILQIEDLNGREWQRSTAVQPSMLVTMPSQTGIYIVNLILANGQKASTNVLVVP